MSGSVAGAETMTLLGAALLDVLDDVGPLGELAGGLDDDVDTEVLPGQLAGVLVGQDLDRPAVDDDRVVGRLNLALEAAEDGVVLEQVGQGLGVGDVVDRHELELGVARGGPEHVAADASETVDADLVLMRCSFRGIIEMSGA